MNISKEDPRVDEDLVNLLITSLEVPEPLAYALLRKYPDFGTWYTLGLTYDKQKQIIRVRTRSLIYE